MRSALPAVTVAALLVLAGCSGADPIPDGPDETTDSVEASPYPPGVNESAVVSTNTLLAAHQDRTRQAGAVVEVTQSVTLPDTNGTVTLQSLSTVRSTPGLTRVHRQQQYEVFGDDGSVVTRYHATYANESAIVTRAGSGENVTVTTDPAEHRSEFVAKQVTRIDVLRQTLTGHDFQVVDTDRRDGRTVTTLVAQETEFTEDGKRVFDATVEVASSGRIRSLSVTRNDDANTAAYRRQMDVTWSNATDVDPPSWAP
ncbi:hypothetical protein [Halobacterium bonnevillei]|uniref:Uncharacterized protein n=1 Tax=Halobacterium bonnevillei TaxID=2692200 RepID=A0A6B0SDV1_9EURY|nr:hypothetical protein [Halobacterium bonnevillei]MXR19598.1 hypothetical protein [Halobacterium bonnevillei]